MSTEKIEELARDIAREQYTDGVPASNAQWGEGDPDDPHWWEDENDDDPDRVVYVAEDGTEVTQRELDALDQLAAEYCARYNINIFN